MLPPAYSSSGPRGVLVCNTSLTSPKTPIPRTKPVGRNISRKLWGRLLAVSTFQAPVLWSFPVTSPLLSLSKLPRLIAPNAPRASPSRLRNTFRIR